MAIIEGYYLHMKTQSEWKAITMWPHSCIRSHKSFLWKNLYFCRTDSTWLGERLLYTLPALILVSMSSLLVGNRPIFQL